MLGDKMNIIQLEEVSSTNLYAKENLDSFEDKTVIIAISQTSGRGRFDRKWVDLGEGNLFMTIVLKPSNSFEEVYANLTQYLSVVLTKILEEYGLSPKIKWPNDVLVNDAKISGILCETVMQGTNFKGLVLGIGVNLNADKGDLKQIKEKVRQDIKECRRDPSTGRILVKKMRNIKAQETRLENKELTEIPDVEEAIKIIANQNISLPSQKKIVDVTFNILRAGEKTLAKNVSLAIYGAKKVAIVGKNGCGKTTLLRPYKPAIFVKNI